MLTELSTLTHLAIPDSFSFAALGGEQLLQEGQQAAEAIAASWDELWTDVISSRSGLYVALTRVGVLFGVGSLMILGVKMVRDIAEKGSLEFIPELIWPLIVVMFLNANGVIMAGFTLNLRDFINRVNQEVLATTSATISLQEAFQKAKNNAAARAEVGALLEQCQSLTGQRQIECLQEADVQSQEIIKVYGLEGNWVTNLHTRIQDAISEAQRLGQSGAQAVNAGFGALIGAGRTVVSRAFLIGAQIAFQQLLEVTMLLTALLGPLALGGSILPVTGKAVYAWLTAMFTVGLAKLCFNIVAGLAATTIVSADSGDPLGFLIFVALLAPFLALALAGGGGMAVWSSITGVSGWIAGMAVRYSGAKP